MLFFDADIEKNTYPGFRQPSEHTGQFSAVTTATQKVAEDAFQIRFLVVWLRIMPYILKKLYVLFCGRGYLAGLEDFTGVFFQDGLDFLAIHGRDFFGCPIFTEGVGNPCLAEP